jgi:hypothetical protein
VRSRDRCLTDLKTQNGKPSASLTGNAVPSALAVYVVLKGTTPNGETQQIRVFGTSYIDTDVTAGTYKVAAINTAGQANSNEVSVSF